MKRNSAVKLRKIGFSPVDSRAVWRSPLSDDIRLLLYFSLNARCSVFQGRL